MPFRHYFLSTFHAARIVPSTRHTLSHLTLIKTQVILPSHFTDKEENTYWCKAQVQGQSVIKGQPVIPSSDLSDFKFMLCYFYQ